MALSKKKVKDQPEETWKPLISDDLLNRIRNIVEQTGLSPSDLVLKWVLQEESLIGLMQSNKGQIAKQSESRPDHVQTLTLPRIKFSLPQRKV
jgi:diketogulonate reductase-like aldo/keto reductase